jgi:GNAT superfamily N-acetyltransferase
MTREWTRGAYVISTDPRRLDLAIVHAFLARAYWSVGLPRAVLERAVENSLVFGLYSPSGQVGFARVVTDFAVFGFLMDVFIHERARGRGLGKWLVETIVSMPELAGFRRWMLVTEDAHELYRRFGFREAAAPDRLMEKVDPDPYGALATATRLA